MGTFGDLMKKAEQEGASFNLLEAGSYVCKCIESEYKLSNNSNKPQIKTRWEVIAGPKAGEKGLWNYFTLTTDNPNALAMFYRQMTAMGITQEYMQSLAQLDEETAVKHLATALDGRTALLKVKVDTQYNNNKVEQIRPVPPEYAAAAPNGPAPDPFAAAAAAPPAAPAPAPQTAPPATEPAPQPAPAQPAPAPAQDAAPAPPPPPF